MIRLLFTILLLAVPAAAQNPSWERWRQDREVRDELRRLNEASNANALAIAELKGSLKWSDRLLYLSLAGLGGAGAKAVHGKLSRKEKI